MSSFLRSLLITHLHFCHGRCGYRRNPSRSQCCACLGQVVETPAAYCLLIVSTCLWRRLNGVEVVAEDILCLWHGVRNDFVNYWLHSALTLLVGRHEGHPACKKIECWFVGGDDLTTSVTINSNKIQSADILVVVVVVVVIVAVVIIIVVIVVVVVVIVVVVSS